jgi:hypothetical protein
MPGLINAPAAMAKIEWADLAKFVLVITMGMTAITAKAGLLVDRMMQASDQGAQGGAPPRASPPQSAKFTPYFSRELEIIFGTLTAVTGLLALVDLEITPPESFPPLVFLGLS